MRPMHWLTAKVMSSTFLRFFVLAALPFAVLAVAITVFLGRSVAIPGTPAAVVHLGVSAVIQTAILILFVAITSRLFQMLASRIVGQVRGQAP